MHFFCHRFFIATAAVLLIGLLTMSPTLSRESENWPPPTMIHVCR